MSAEIVRKVLHTLLALGFVFAGVLFGATTTVILALVLVCMVVAARYLGRLLPYQVARVTYGEVFFALGVALSAVAFLPEHATAFMVSMLVLGCVDTAAALVGRRWGSHTYKIFGEVRSYEGSLTALGVAAILFYVWGVSFWWALIAGWGIAALEALAPRGSDNLVLPLAAGMLLVLLS